MLISEAFELWATAHPRWSATAHRYAQGLDRLAKLGLVTVEETTRTRVAEVQAQILRRGWTNESVRAEFNGLRAVLAHLDDLELLEPGQLAGVRKAALKRSEVRRRRVRFLAREEFDSLANGAARLMPRLELPIRVAFLAGPRVGELARMRAEDVRPDGSFDILTLPEWGEAGSCKTGPRVVPICSELRGLLETRLPQSGWLFPAGFCAKKDQTSRPFMSRGILERGLRRLRRALGMADDITWIVLRHSRASSWLQGGASIYKVADWLGDNVGTIETFYGSLVDGYDSECERAPWGEIDATAQHVAPAAVSLRTGPPPFGYRRAPSGLGLEVDVDAAATVRLVFSLYIEKKSAVNVGRELALRGLGSPARGPTWHPETVRSTLRNRAYVGLLLREGRECRGPFQAIVERTTFDRVQQLLTRNDTRARSGARS